MFVDAPENQCVTATFVFGTSTESRQYDIKVAQYQCGAEAAGPPDCLQYHTGLSGTIANFGFPTTSTSVSATSMLIPIFLIIFQISISFQPPI